MRYKPNSRPMRLVDVNRSYLLSVFFALAFIPNLMSQTDPQPKVVKTDAEWREALSDFEYQVTRKKGTERAFSGEYWDAKTPGTYVCRCCDTPLFSSQTKFDSGTGWPSFWAPLAPAAVAEHSDSSYGMVRTEVTLSLIHI